MKNSSWSIGIDLGGTKIAAAMVGPHGEISHEKVVPTNANEGAEAIVDKIASLIVELRNAAKDVKC
ncbi:MAG: ROK family protein, partial [Parachlamydiaceae bacterium]|nr:ROK family protein [Parachlamydiaceae bacterium]